MIKEQLTKETTIYYFKKIPDHVPAWMEKRYWAEDDYAIFQESKEDCFAIARDKYTNTIGACSINEHLSDDYPFRLIVIIPEEEE